MVGTVEIGGINHFIISNSQKGFLGSAGIINSANAIQKEITSDFIDIEPAENLIFQHWVTVPLNGQCWHAWQFFDVNKRAIGGRPTGKNAYNIYKSVTNCHNVNYIKAPENAYYIRISARMYEDGKIKLERGNIPTEWTPADEDTQETINSKADQGLTQEQLNKLAERDNVLKAELEAKAALSVVEKWIKEIQNLAAVEEAGRKSAESAITKASERMIDLQRKVGELQTVTEFVNTYMSQSDEGLIVGRKDGSSKVLVSHDRISFVSGGKEVASISQGVLKIDNGVFVKSLRIGRFVTMQDPTNPDRNLTMYVGGA